MDTSGNIRELHLDEELRENEIMITQKEKRNLSGMTLKKRKNWMRNQPCPCGSGKKFKKCCWVKMSKSAVGINQ